jgi:hypothetical protein
MRESFMLAWLSADIVIGDSVARGSIMRTILSLQLVANTVPSCFQLNDCITSGCSLLADGKKRIYEISDLGEQDFFTYKKLPAVLLCPTS